VGGGQAQLHGGPRLEISGAVADDLQRHVQQLERLAQQHGGFGGYLEFFLTLHAGAFIHQQAERGSPVAAGHRSLEQAVAAGASVVYKPAFLSIVKGES
jgi:hypothetical protein